MHRIANPCRWVRLPLAPPNKVKSFHPVSTACQRQVLQRDRSWRVARARPRQPREAALLRPPGVLGSGQSSPVAQEARLGERMFKGSPSSVNCPILARGFVTSGSGLSGDEPDGAAARKSVWSRQWRRDVDFRMLQRPVQADQGVSGVQISRMCFSLNTIELDALKPAGFQPGSADS